MCLVLFLKIHVIWKFDLWSHVFKYDYFKNWITSKYLVWVQQQSGKNFIILKHIHSTELKSLLHKVLEELHYGYIFQNILVSIPRVKYLNKNSSGNFNYHLKLALNVPLFFVALYDVRLSCVKNLALSNY